LKNIYILIALIVFSTLDNANAQRKRKSRGRKSNAAYILQHEVGISAGVSNFQGDFTSEGLLDGLVTVNGFSINALHSMHLIKSRRKRRGARIRRRRKSNGLLSHFMLKSNIGYTKGSFDNFGISDGNGAIFQNFNDGNTNNDVNSIILQGKTTSETSIITFGTQIEYYFQDLVSYLHRSSRARALSRNRYRKRSRSRYRRRKRKGYRRRGQSLNKGNIYLTAGFGLNIVNSTFSYPFEDATFRNSTTDANGNSNPDNINLTNGRVVYPDALNENVYQDYNKAVFSLTAGLGYRYKISRTIDIFTEIKYNTYATDFIDGVNPSISPLINNSIDTDNDYNTNISLGVIYHLF